MYATFAGNQTWLDFAINCQYISSEKGEEFYMTYNQVLAGLVSMIRNPSPWLLRRQEAEAGAPRAILVHITNTNRSTFPRAPN